MPNPPAAADPPELPLVASLIGTFLKPEMRSVYRQLTGLQRNFRTVVFTERRTDAAEFPFEPVVVMERAAGPASRAPRGPRAPKPPRKRPRGNFVRRFYYKHLLGVWPPPVKVPAPAILTGTTIADAAGSPLLPLPSPALAPDPYNLLPLLAAYRPALLHVYYGHKAVKFLPLLRRWGGPVVVSFHGLDAADAAYPKFPGGAGEALPAVFTHARLVLARSQSLLDRLLTLGCPPEKLRLNRAPVPLDDLPPLPVAPPADGAAWRLLQACRLIPKKGLTTTLLAFREILRFHPHARLTVAGDGPQGGELRALAAELGILDRVNFAGWCGPERLKELLAQTHVFLHPSEHTPGGDREGVPNSLLEAMAAGLPVVATTHGGIPEAVTDGVDGVLVPERDPAALGAAVLRLLGQPELMKTLADKARINTRVKFGASEQCARLAHDYRSVLWNDASSNPRQ